MRVDWFIGNGISPCSRSWFSLLEGHKKDSCYLRRKIEQALSALWGAISVIGPHNSALSFRA
jgi:hypothetical protein